jgi:hypothetical protein
MVTVIDSVRSRNDDSPGVSETRQFTIDTSVCDASKAAPVHFSVACFLEDTKRWQRVKLPPPGALLSVTAKLAGRTADTNYLALRVLDLTYLLRPASAAAAPTPTDTPPSKRSGRWDGRAAPSTPSKRQRVLEPASEAVNPSDEATTRTEGTRGTPEDTIELTSVPASPSNTADPKESSLTSISSLTAASGTRPHRGRLRKYTDTE